MIGNSCQLILYEKGFPSIHKNFSFALDRMLPYDVIHVVVIVIVYRCLLYVYKLRNVKGERLKRSRCQYVDDRLSLTCQSTNVISLFFDG